MSGSCCCGCNSLRSVLGPHLTRHLQRRIRDRISVLLKGKSWKKGKWKDLRRTIREELKAEADSWRFVLRAPGGPHWIETETNEPVGYDKPLRLQDILTTEVVQDLVRQTLRIVRQRYEECGIQSTSSTQLAEAIAQSMVRLFAELECRYDERSGSCRWYNPATGKWGKACYVECVYVKPTPGE